MMRWKIIIIFVSSQCVRGRERKRGADTEREIGFKLIAHQLIYSVCHYFTENLITPHKE